MLAQEFSVQREGLQEDVEVNEREHGDQGGEGRHFQGHLWCPVKDRERPGAEHCLLNFRSPDDVNPVSAAVAQALARSGLSQTEVAQRMGTTQSVVSRMADPAYFGHSVPTLQRFAQAVGAGLRVDFGEVERSA